MINITLSVRGNNDLDVVERTLRNTPRVTLNFQTKQYRRPLFVSQLKSSIRERICGFVAIVPTCVLFR